MAFVYDNKEYRNLQQQVFKNMNDISFILQEEGVLNEFGIKVVGQEASAIDMPSVDDYKEDNPEWAYGDAYAVGTEAPYELYVLTRANGSHPNDYWFNIGEFPAPGPEGPEGPQGEQGVQGQTGPAGQDGVSPEFSIGTVSASTISAGQSATASVSMTGTYAQPVLNFAFEIPAGQDGSTLTSIAWGDITGSLANQTDLVSALQGKANASALASYATQVYADNVASNATYQANVYTDSAISALSSVYTTETWVLSQNYLSAVPAGYATEAWVSANFLSADTPLGGDATWGSISGTLSDQTDLMSKFSEYAPLSAIPSLSGYATEAWVASQNYASQTWVNSQISAATSEFITSAALTGLASEGYVDNQISGLSSVYASIGALPNMSLYAELSGSNTYTNWNRYSNQTVFNGSVQVNSTFSIGNVGVIASSANFIVGSNYSTSFYGHVRFSSNVTFGSSVAFSAGAIYNGSTFGTAKKLSLPSQSGSLALIADITALDYASVGALSAGTVIPDITGLASESYVDSSISALSSVYQPIGSYVSQADLSGYAQLSASNTFTGSNTFNTIYVSNVGSIYKQGTLGQDILYLSAADALALTASTQIYGDANTYNIQAYNYISVYAGSSINLQASSIYLSGSAYYKGSEIATINDIPVVSGTNDGTYWTSITIDEDTYDIPQGGGSGDYVPVQVEEEEDDVVQSGTITNTSTEISAGVNYQDNSDDSQNKSSNLNLYQDDAYLGHSYSGQVMVEEPNPNYDPEDPESGEPETITTTMTVGLGTSLHIGDGYAEIIDTVIDGESTADNTYDLISACQTLSSIASDYASVGYVGSAIASLSSVYAPVGYLPSGVSGYASEVWTFTLSDNTSVSKTILVG